ncbi:hypothetical protein [Streptomyces roseolus]|uniref:hypothetical protein n=1 Tax=Streptomyces roseolus TaxID=67358 RepID=UPI0036E28134
MTNAHGASGTAPADASASSSGALSSSNAHERALCGSRAMCEWTRPAIARRSSAPDGSGVSRPRVRRTRAPTDTDRFLPTSPAAPFPTPSTNVVKR